MFVSKKKHYQINKNSARALIMARINYFAQAYGVTTKRIAIRNQKTRWGSCSKAGNLNFNYKLIFLSPDLIDYVIVHELCHLIEFNHSPKFWLQVAKAIPDYGNLRKKLQKVDLRKLGFSIINI